MVTDTVVTISEEMRNVGWFILDKLEKNSFPVDAMFWSDFYEEDFRLFLVTSLVDSQGIGKTYDLLSDMFKDSHLDSEFGFSVYDINLIGLAHPKIDQVRRRYGVVPSDRRWVRRVSLSAGGAYVYCLK